MMNFVCVKDYEEKALNLLSPNIRDFFRGGSGEESTLKWNREAFRKIRILPRMMRNVKNVDITTTILGEKVSMPLGISPTAMQKMAHPDGECANAKAAEAAGIIYTLSTLSSASIEEVAKAAPKCIKWFQIYVFPDRKLTLDLVRRAEKSGYKALVVTVDSPTAGNRRNELRNNFKKPPHIKFANLEDYSLENSFNNNYPYSLRLDSSLSWKDISWLKKHTSLPIVIKGILTAEDALLSIKYGANAILISNHGGRQTDGAPATIEVLPEIVKAVGEKVEIYVDGGFSQGSDVFKALALGAKMALFGRPILWALACEGEKGAKNILEIMKKDIILMFTLTGCRSIKEVTKNMICHESKFSRL
ncbi:2-Hydroxyacid oxidase 1-like [Leptopilina boulardi]|uniref:2-Hydroxyacid oxidase 1-like n=1 Tax=Leptopilina boulardi TaxID=63433 RepID=UPI0021F60665|nr:2-Hydroxyacid oxidase 1-like [Leptopilina boulardi]